MAQSKEAEVNKLRRQLLKQKEKTQQYKQEMYRLEMKITQLTLEKEEIHKKNYQLQDKARKIDDLLELRVREARQQQLKKYQKESTRLIELEQKLSTQKKLIEKYEEELESKGYVISQWQQKASRLQAQSAGAEQQENEGIDDLKDERLNIIKNNKKLKMDYDRLYEQANNLFAENRVLRKLAQVPENYGFDLEDIKLSEKQKIEDYKAQIRYLEREVEELQAERTNLRHRLRTISSLYSTQPETRYQDLKSEELVALDQYLLDLRTGKGRGAFNQDSKKELEKKLIELKKELQMYQNEGFGPGSGARSQGPSKRDIDLINKMNESTIQELKQANNSLRSLIDQLMEKIDNLGNMGGVQRSDDNRGSGRTKQEARVVVGTEFDRHGKPPVPMAGPFGNWDDIREGHSFKFSSQLSVDLYEMYGQGGFDQIRAKYQLASLQLQNIETMHTLTQKQREYNSLSNEMRELKDELRNSLLIQDQLFQKHFYEKQQLLQNIQFIENEKQNFLEENAELQVQLEKYVEFAESIEKRSPELLEGKLATMTKRTAILDVNLIKVARKYAALKDQQNEMEISYQEIDQKYAQREEDLLNEIMELRAWQKKAGVQLKILFGELKEATPLQEHNIIRNQMQFLMDQLANVRLKESELIQRNAQNEGALRDLHETQEQLRMYQEQQSQIFLEQELLKKRLEERDPVYKKYQNVYNRLVDTLKKKNLSPLETFQMMDVNKDGKIGKTEFSKAMQSLGVYIESDELEVLFSFLDLDNTQTIQYQEFLKQLRRSGVSVRQKQEELIYALYEGIKKAGLSLKAAFDAFDNDRDNVIRKNEMADCIKQMNIMVPKETVDYVFKMADTSGDGQITYDQFRILFENIIKDAINQDQFMISEDLDWRKALMLKIDAAVHQEGVSVLEIYQLIDVNDDDSITINQFQTLFRKLDLDQDLDEEHIQSLFSAMDQNNDRSITYNQLLNFIRESKRDQERIDRYQLINKRTQQLRENMPQLESDQLGKQQISLESRLQMKISLYEQREQNLNKHLDQLKNQIMREQKTVTELNKRILELENQSLSNQQNYQEQFHKSSELQEQIKGCISQEESQKLHYLNEKLTREIVDLRGAYDQYRRLFEAASSSSKILKIQSERHRSEIENLQQAVKDLQSTSDEKACIGKLYHQVMIIRFNLGHVSRKYDEVMHELNHEKIQIKTTENILQNKEEELIQINQAFIIKTNSYEQEINELKGRIIPTVTLARIEEMNNRITEISQMKYELELANRKLRDENYELALQVDYYDTANQSIEELTHKLRNRHPDDIQQDLIDLSMKMAELKTTEMKSKRDAQLSREQEEYYQRINRQYLQNIRDLESELAQHHLKLNQREEFWRKRHSEQMQRIFNIDAHAQGESEKLDNISDTLKKRAANRSDTPGGPKSTTLPGGGKEKEGYNQARDIIIQKDQMLKEKQQEVTGLQAEIDELYKKIEKMEEATKRRQTSATFMMHSGVGLSKENIDIIARQAVKEDNQNIAKAARDTILTLQSIIDDKSAQLERKDREIKNLKQKFDDELRKYADEMNQLNGRLDSNNMSSMNQNVSNIGGGNRGGMNIENPTMYWNDVGKTLNDQDRNIEEITEQLNDKIRTIDLNNKQIKNLKEKLKELQGELAIEQQKNETDNLKRKLETMDKLLKLQEKEIQGFQTSMTKLKQDFFKTSEEKNDQEEDFKEKILQTKEQKSKYEIQMQKAMKELKQLKLDLKDTRQKLEMQAQQKIEIQGQLTETKEEFAQYKARFGPKKVGQSKSEAVGEMENKIKQLEKDNLVLQQQVELLQKSKGEEGLFDSDRNIQPEEGMRFSSLDELIARIQIWLQMNPSLDIFAELKQRDEQKTGILNGIAFYKTLSLHSINFTEDAKKLLEKEIREDTKDVQINLSKFYYLFRRNLKDTQMETNITFDWKKTSNTDVEAFLNKNSSFQKAPGGSVVKDQSPLEKKMQFGGEEEQASEHDKQSYLRNEELLKKMNAELKNEQEELQRQIMTLKQKLKRSDQEGGKTGTGSNFYNDRNGHESGLSPQQKAIENELYQAQIFDLEEKLRDYQKQIQIQDASNIKKLKQEKLRLEQEIKHLRLEHNQVKSQLDNFLQSQIGPDDAQKEVDRELQATVTKFKEKLNTLRENERILQDQLYQLEKKNSELVHIQQHYDLDVERLQRRISELEDLQVAVSSASAVQKVPEQSAIQREPMIQTQQIERKSSISKR